MKARAFSLITLLLLPMVFSTGCETVGSGKRTAIGTGLGALAGAGVGALVGAARGDAAKGALIGAAAGAAIGGVTGAVMDKQAEDLRKAGIRAERDEAGNMLIQLSGDSLKFDTGKATIQATGQQVLANLASVISKYPENRIAISGHTDNAGNASSNQSLSQQRADAVQFFLLKKGVAAKSVTSSTGFGQTRPKYDNKTAAGKAANRRVELAITVDETEAEANQKTRESYKNRNAQ